MQTIATSTGSLPWAVAPQRSARSSRSGSRLAHPHGLDAGGVRGGDVEQAAPPAPTTSTASPAATPARRWARSAQAERLGEGGEHRVHAVERQQLADQLGWMRTYSAKPPGSSRVERKRSHSVSWPRRQRRHSPHGAWWWIATRSPTRHALDARADLDHLAGRLVAEHGGQLAADVERLHVGAAGRARQHAAHDLAGPGDRVGRLLEDRLVLGERARDLHPARW